MQLPQLWLWCPPPPSARAPLDDNVFAVIGLDDDVAHISLVITMSLLELLLVTHSWTMSLLEHCTSTMYTMCKLYKHNKQNKHNANLTMSPPLEPHAPQLENQAPWQAAVVLVAIVVVVTAVVVVVLDGVVLTAVLTVVVQAVVAKTRHHVQGRHFNFLQSFLSTPGFEISFLTQIWQFSRLAPTSKGGKNEKFFF